MRKPDGDAFALGRIALFSGIVLLLLLVPWLVLKRPPLSLYQTLPGGLLLFSALIASTQFYRMIFDLEDFGLTEIAVVLAVYLLAFCALLKMLALWSYPTDHFTKLIRHATRRHDPVFYTFLCLLLFPLSLILYILHRQDRL